MEHKELKSSVGKKSADIWTAYQEVLAELKAKEGAPPSTAVVAQQKKVTGAVEASSKLDVAAVLAGLERMGGIFKENALILADLNTAIDAKKQELRDVHGLEIEANSAVALVAAKDRLIEEKAATALSIIEKAQETAKALKDEAQFEAENLKKVADAKFRYDEQARARAAEEWEYKFQRDCRSKDDTFQDGINKRAKAALEREEAVAAREAKLKEIEAKTLALQEALNKADETRGAAVAKAVAECEAAARKSEAIQKNIIDRAHAADVAVLNGEIKSLKEQNAELRQRLERAENQVSEANNRMTTIATASLKAGADAATVAEVAKVAAGAGGGKK